MSNPQYVSLPGELPLSLMRPSDLGLYALIHSLSGLPKEYHFSTSGLSVYANGKCAAVRSALKRLSGLGLISVDRPKVTSATMQISFSETFGKSVPVWNGYLFRKDLSLEAKGIAIGMQLAISVSARELAKKIKASRSTIQRYQKELCESHVILLIGSRSDDGKFAYNDAMLLGSDGGPAVRLLRSAKKNRSSFCSSRASKTVAQNSETNKVLDLKNSKSLNNNTIPVINHKTNASDVSTTDEIVISNDTANKLLREKISYESVSFEAETRFNDTLSESEFEDILSVLADGYCSVHELSVCGTRYSFAKVREILSGIDGECVASAIHQITEHQGPVRNERKYFLVTIIRQILTKTWRKRQEERSADYIAFHAPDQDKLKVKRDTNRFECFTQREYTQEFWEQIELAMRKRRADVI